MAVKEYTISDELMLHGDSVLSILDRDPLVSRRATLVSSSPSLVSPKMPDQGQTATAITSPEDKLSLGLGVTWMKKITLQRGKWDAIDDGQRSQLYAGNGRMMTNEELKSPASWPDIVGIKPGRRPYSDPFTRMPYEDFFCLDAASEERSSVAHVLVGGNWAGILPAWVKIYMVTREGDTNLGKTWATVKSWGNSCEYYRMDLIFYPKMSTSNIKVQSGIRYARRDPKIYPVLPSTEHSSVVGQEVRGGEKGQGLPDPRSLASRSGGSRQEVPGTSTSPPSTRGWADYERPKKARKSSKSPYQ